MPNKKRASEDDGEEVVASSVNGDNSMTTQLIVDSDGEDGRQSVGSISSLTVITLLDQTLKSISYIHQKRRRMSFEASSESELRFTETSDAQSEVEDVPKSRKGAKPLFLAEEGIHDEETVIHFRQSGNETRGMNVDSGSAPGNDEDPAEGPLT
jgi:hypothetical protein